MNARREPGVPFGAHLILNTAVVLVITVALLTVLITRNFITAVWEESESTILAQCRGVEAQIDAKLNEAYQAAVELQQSANVNSYLTTRYSDSLQKVRARRSLLS